MSLMRESLILIIIGLLDLLLTLFFLGAKSASEGNPLMAYYLQFGVGAFVLAKLGLLFLPVFVAEWSKRYKPRFVRLMLRGTIAMYLGTYLLLFALVNIAPIIEQDNPDHSRPSTRIAERTKGAS